MGFSCDLEARRTEGKSAQKAFRNSTAKFFTKISPIMVSNETLHLFIPIETLKRTRFCSFVVGLHLVQLLWLWKISSFGTEIFKNSQFFYLYGQYIHEIKVKNILNSILRRKSTIVFNFFCKNWIFKNYRLYFDEKKNFS